MHVGFLIRGGELQGYYSKGGASSSLKKRQASDLFQSGSFKRAQQENASSAEEFIKNALTGKEGKDSLKLKNRTTRR